MIEIAVADQNDQLIEANLEGQNFYIRLSWNESGQFFSVGIQTNEGETLVEGITLVVGYPLLRRLRNSRLPAGDFMLVSADGKEINRQSFVNKTANLCYLTKQDLIAANLSSLYGFQ